MAKKSTSKKSTTVGSIDARVLAFTAGEDAVLDLALVEADCIGSAAHAVMLSKMPVKPRLFSPSDCKRIISELNKIIRTARQGKFKITMQDQDVHLAIERTLTRSLGDLGKKIHTGRSRNDQVAVDLRLFAKVELIQILEHLSSLATGLIHLAQKHERVPMVGRTHLQPAMPSSVALWASAHAESLLDDMVMVMQAYELNDQCPLGSAAGYGVPLPIDRQLVSDLLGFSRPCHNVLYASQTRGKLEATILAALSQVMLTLSRCAEDLILFTMPEFGYFTLPDEFCTGSSIMPQKKNPDVLELIRAKASKVSAHAFCVQQIVTGLPSGYQRDLQEAKGPFLDGLSITKQSIEILAALMKKIKVNKKALREAFTPEVFATDRALEYVAGGMPFREAYRKVKKSLDQLGSEDPDASVARKSHLGATGGLDLVGLNARALEAAAMAGDERKQMNGALSKLLGVKYAVR